MKMKLAAAGALIAFSAISAQAQYGSSEKSMSIYERVGGIHKIAQFASDAVDMESKDELLLKNPKFREAAMLSRPVFKFLLTGYLASSFGGPQMYSGPDISAIVKGFGFTKAQNERAWSLRMEAMTKAGVSKDLQKQIRAWAEKAERRAKPMDVPKMETFANADSLYARLGGIAPISMVVNDFVDQLGADPVIGSNPNTVKAFQSGRISGAGLKYLVTEQVAQAAGGPWKYSGRSMKESHMHLMISEKEFEVGAGILKRVLDAYKVPAKEQGEIFAVIGSTKGDIVKP